MSFQLSKDENNYEREESQIIQKSSEFNLSESEILNISGIDDMSEKEEIRNIIYEMNKNKNQNDEKFSEFNLIESEQKKQFCENDTNENMKFNNTLNGINKSKIQYNNDIEKEKKEEEIEKWKNDFEKELKREWIDDLENEFKKEFHKKWKNEYIKKFDEKWRNKYEKKFSLTWNKNDNFENSHYWESYFNLYLKKNINYFKKCFYENYLKQFIKYFIKYFKNVGKSTSEFFLIFTIIHIRKILLEEKTNKIIDKIQKEIKNLFIDIDCNVNKIKEIIDERILEKMKYYWERISIYKSLIEKITKDWIIEGIAKKKNEIKTKEEWNNAIIREILLLCDNNIFGFILMFVKLSLKLEKRKKKEENKSKKEDLKKLCFFIENEKIGNINKKNTFRYDNQMNMIIRNLIQDIFLKWIM